MWFIIFLGLVICYPKVAFAVVKVVVCGFSMLFMLYMGVLLLAGAIQ